ncbi:RNA polymerase sigma factor [Novosphingobium sp. 9U]|uniref:RNA polymerase sigma factor n=1 Tax=Novosphingobium sp. 9U TaxID=2653158 RepID=UPI0012F1BE46|nr:hypothetical protein NOVOSPHI9U_260027 [Novosphingobium sp. 9U]
MSRESSAPDGASSASALRSWHDRDARWLCEILQRRLRVDRAQADDIAQETWVRVLRATQAGVEHPRAFLLKIAINLFRDARRRDNLQGRKLKLWSSPERPAFRPTNLEEQEVDTLLE